MADVPVSLDSMSVRFQEDFVSSDIDRRIRIEQVAPLWLVQAILDDITKQGIHELVKEAVADVRNETHKMHRCANAYAYAYAAVC